jgi:peptidoglycan/xylan/chitin deacetylase (PgdA/CDA1 family)
LALKKKILAGALFVFVCLIPFTALSDSTRTPPAGSEAPKDQGSVEDILAPQPTAPGDRATVRALVRNTGGQPWSEGTQVRFWIKSGGKVIWERFAGVEGQPAGSAAWAEKTFTLPDKFESGEYRISAEIINGEKGIAKSPQPAAFYADPYAYSDDFERKDVVNGKWDFKHAGKGDKITTTSSISYSRARCLTLDLEAGGEAYLQYEFLDGEPDRLSISMRIRIDQKAYSSGGPVNFFAAFGDKQHVAAYFYYHTDKKWFQIDYRKSDGSWDHSSISKFHLQPDVWYHTKTTLKLGGKGFLALAVNGREIIRKKADLLYGGITNLAIGHYPNDKRLKGRVYIDDVRWARTGIDSFGQGRVSLTFDDGALSQWTTAKPLLDKYGFKTSFYVITDNAEFPVDSKTGIEYAMSRDKLLSLQQQGHFVGSHTQNHRRLANLPGTLVNEELTVSKQKLESWGINPQAVSFPYGSYNDDVIRRASKRYRLCLTTMEGINPYDAIMDGRRLMRVDPTNKPFSDVKELIRETKQTGGWLVFYIHAVGSGHADDKYYYPTSSFERVLQYLKRKGLKVIPIEWAP